MRAAQQRVREACGAAAAAALEERLPEILRRIGDAVPEWVEIGLRRHRGRPDAARAFFALETAGAERALRRFDPAALLVEARLYLEPYVHALLGRRVPLVAAEGAQSGWRAATAAAPEAIRLPAEIRLFPSRDLNERSYRFAVTHLAGFELAGMLSPPTSAPGTLARQVERLRRHAAVDGRLAARFAGFRRDLAWARRVLLEESEAAASAGPGLAPDAALLEGVFRALWSADGSDAPQSTSHAAGDDLARRPAVAEPARPRRRILLGRPAEEEVAAARERLDEQRRRVEELRRALAERSEEDGDHDLPPLLDSLAQDLLGVLSLQDGHLFGTSGLMQLDPEEVGDLLAQAPVEELAETARELVSEAAARRGGLWVPATSRATVFHYDEWDYRAGDYRRRWCRLFQRRLGESEIDPAEILRRYAGEREEIQRQFERLRPERIQRRRGLEEGEDLDLERAVDLVVSRRAGVAPPERVFEAREKQLRDVAAVFLLDMSASTDTPVDEDQAGDRHDGPSTAGDRGGDGDLRGEMWSSFGFVPPPVAPRRRVIDVERESVLLMADALESLGDAYGVYGFSGSGRAQVDFYVAKELDEPWDAAAARRIAAIEPKQSTRMGPAIRHAAWKLRATDAAVRTILIVSDGYPQDSDYGPERGDRTYGIEDTMVALREAELEGIHTFCLTVDPAGHDYLRQMAPDRQYLVIDEVAALPRVLPKVYRGITS